MRYYLNKLINSLNRFMYGRYKGDELNRFLIIVYFVFYILSFIPIPFFLGFFQLLSTLIFVLILFRALSKNIYSRQQELYKYLNLKNKVKSNSNTEKLIYILNAEIAKQILEFQKAREKLKLHVQSANTLWLNILKRRLIYVRAKKH